MKIVRFLGFAVLVAIVAASPLFAGNYPVKLLQEILMSAATLRRWRS